MTTNDPNTITMTIDYDAVRNNFLRDVEIYGGCIARAIAQAPYDEPVAVDANDVHGLLAALNIAFACVTDEDALNAVRNALDKITTNVAAANQARRNKEYEDDDE